MRSPILFNILCLLLTATSLIIANESVRPFQKLDAVSTAQVSAAIEKVNSPAEVEKLKQFTLSHCKALDDLGAMVQSEARTLMPILGLVVVLLGMQLCLLVVHGRKASSQQKTDG